MYYTYMKRKPYVLWYYCEETIVDFAVILAKQGDKYIGLWNYYNDSVGDDGEWINIFNKEINCDNLSRFITNGKRISKKKVEEILFLDAI